MKKEANVFLIAKESELYDLTAAPLGNLNRSEIMGYTYELTNLHVIPSDSCVSELSINERKTNQTKLTKNTNYEPETSSCTELCLEVVPQMGKTSCFASNASQCMRFISSGKCKDPFIIENIGKKFFPNLYEKQH